MANLHDLPALSYRLWEVAVGISTFAQKIATAVFLHPGTVAAWSVGVEPGTSGSITLATPDELAPEVEVLSTGT